MWINIDVDKCVGVQVQTHMRQSPKRDRGVN